MKIIDVVAVASSALTAGGASVGSVALGAGPWTATGVAVACAGSASAVIFSAINGHESPTNIWRGMLLSFCMFVIGTFFGLFMAGTFERLPMIDHIGALYLASLTGYALVGLLLSPDMRHALMDFLKGWLHK